MLSIKITESTLNRIINDYKNNVLFHDIGNILYVFLKNNNMISIYKFQNKNFYKAFFQGPLSYDLIDKYNDENIILPKKNRFLIEEPSFIDINSQVGNFDVGSEELFGPIVFTSSYIDEETMKLLNNLKIYDLRKLDDKTILSEMPNLVKKVHFENKILNPVSINAAIDGNFPLNKIKTIIHDNLIKKMMVKFPYSSNIYIEKYCEKDEYMSYLKEKINNVNGLVIDENSFNLFPSISLSYNFSRYFYLKSIEELNSKYNVNFPKISSKKIKLFCFAFIRRFGIEEFNKVSKKYLPIYKEIINEYNIDKNK